MPCCNLAALSAGKYKVIIAYDGLRKCSSYLFYFLSLCFGLSFSFLSSFMMVDM